MNGRTFYAGGAGGSRVVLAAVPRLTPLGLYGHTHHMPSKPTGRKAAGAPRKTPQLRKRNGVSGTIAPSLDAAPPNRAHGIRWIGVFRRR